MIIIIDIWFFFILFNWRATRTASQCVANKNPWSVSPQKSLETKQTSFVAQNPFKPRRRKRRKEKEVYRERKRTMALWMEAGADPMTDKEKADLDAIAALKQSSALELKVLPPLLLILFFPSILQNNTTRR